MENINKYEFSENQKNLWQIGSEKLESFYHQVLLVLDNAVDTDYLVNAIQAVVLKHEALSFKTQSDKNYLYPFQQVSATSEIEYHEVESGKINTHDFGAFINDELNYTYDSSKNEPLRLLGIKREGKVKYLAVRLYALWGDNIV